MSMPSDVNADVAEAVDAIEKRVPPKLRHVSRSLFRQVSPEQYGFAAATLVAFVGVAVCGPRLREMLQPRRRGVVDRARRATREAAYEARSRAENIGEEASHRLHRLGEATFGR